jgi:nitroreductase
MDNKDHILIEGFKHVRYRPTSFEDEIMLERAAEFYHWLDTRRSVRSFTDKPVDPQVIRHIIKAASTAPSGAHKQPWTFCVVSDPEIKKQIRGAAEEEERRSYNERMSDSWLEDLKPMGTDANKPFLEIAPYLIVVFKKPYDYDDEGNKRQNYYVNESVGLACGMLIAAIHHAGLVTLTHTPSPMRFLEKILERPDNERAFLLLPVGHAADETYVPDISRKGPEDIMKWF